jgi:drug/metabolite transporter (DMT)-like permease
MFASAQFVPVCLSLVAVLVWGTSDFLGGYGVKRANAFVFTAIAHGSGLLLMAGFALASHSAYPSRNAAGWALAAGLCGGAALAIFYRALASGRMGLTAPVAAVLGAAIPTAFGIVTQGLPGPAPVAGFVLAGVGIWLISGVEDHHRPEGVGLAVLAGIGFAGFYLCAHQAGSGSALWITATVKTASLVLTAMIVLIGVRFRDGGFQSIDRRGVALAFIAGGLDATGSLLYIRAAQIGRLDQAVVLTSLYPAITVLLARIFLREHFTRWKAVGILAALLAVPMIAWQ